MFPPMLVLQHYLSLFIITSMQNVVFRKSIFIIYNVCERPITMEEGPFLDYMSRKNHIITSWFIHANCLSQYCINKKPLEIQWKSKTLPIFEKSWILDLNVSKIVWFERHNPPLPPQKAGIFFTTENSEINNIYEITNLKKKSITFYTSWNLRFL